jgi:hypothetical protein
VRDFEAFFFIAFFELSTERYDELLPIPWGAVLNYAAHYNLDDEMRDDLFIVIDKMDRAYLEMKNEWIKQQEKGGTK